MSAKAGDEFPEYEQAAFWAPLESGGVQCRLCPHQCKILEGKDGICQARGCRQGKLWAMTYGRISAMAGDPIEKKPLYHFHPGTVVFSIGSWGCNLGCQFCQNWKISQRMGCPTSRKEPEAILRGAIELGAVGVAYTYNEPLIAFEFVEKCMKLVRASGLVNVLVTNGYINPEPAAQLIPWVDALNIDIKSMDPEFYRQICGGSLAPVLKFSELAVRSGCHVEITNLVIPGLNDKDEEWGSLSRWISDHLGPKTPLHLSAYHPEYKMDVNPTPWETLKRGYEICARNLTYVYLGNVRARREQDTRCPNCMSTLIHREGYQTECAGLNGCFCRVCGAPADIITGSKTRKNQQPDAYLG